MGGSPGIDPAARRHLRLAGAIRHAVSIGEKVMDQHGGSGWRCSDVLKGLSLMILALTSGVKFLLEAMGARLGNGSVRAYMTWRTRRRDRGAPNSGHLADAGDIGASSGTFCCGLTRDSLAAGMLRSAHWAWWRGVSAGIPAHGAPGSRHDSQRALPAVASSGRQPSAIAASLTDHDWRESCKFDALA